jgi:hypothetical protein
VNWTALKGGGKWSIIWGLLTERETLVEGAVREFLLPPASCWQNTEGKGILNEKGF